MSESLRGTVAFKHFLVFFWCIWWLVICLSHLAGIAQFWAWLPGNSLTSHYVSIAQAIGPSHIVLSNIIFLVSLVLQIIAAVHFLRALFSMGSDNWHNNVSHAFVYSLSIFMLLYASYLLLQFLGANFVDYYHETMRMIILQFLCTLFVILA